VRDFSAVELEALRDFTNPSNVARLYELGCEAAIKQIDLCRPRRPFVSSRYPSELRGASGVAPPQ
jgi:hypothetical protein